MACISILKPKWSKIEICKISRTHSALWLPKGTQILLSFGRVSIKPIVDAITVVVYIEIDVYSTSLDEE